MIQYQPSTEYIAFRFIKEGNTLAFSQWEEDEEACVYSELLQEFVDNGLAVVDGDACNVSYDGIYKLSTYERRALGLPEIYPYTIYIQPKGLLRDSSFQYVVSYRQSKLGRRFAVKREGAVIYTGHSEYLLRMEQLRLVEAIDEYNALPIESKSLNGNLIAFCQIKGLSELAQATLDKYLTKENVFVPSRLKIEVDKIGEDCYEVYPTIESPLSDQFDRYLESREQAPDNIALTDDNNDRVRVVLDDDKQKLIRKIRKNYRRVSSKALKELVDNPALHLDPDQCDLSTFYSDRVIEIGLYKPKVYPFVSPFTSSWLSPTYEVEDKINGNSKLTFKSEEEVNEFEQQTRLAIAEGKSSISYKNISLNVNDALDIAKNAHEQFEKKKQKEEKKVLIVEENADELGYQVEFSKQERTNKYIFSTIPGLRDGIKLKQHQVEGVAWLQHLVTEHSKGCLLADDMGLGKTLQLLSLIDWHDRKYNDTKKPYLIVAPISLLENWENEYIKFFEKPRIPVRVVTSSVAKHFTKGIDRNFIQFLQHRHIILTNYETVRSYQFSFCAVDFAIVALDEAQKIKTPGTLVTNAAKALKAEFKVAMTGTPVENTMVDLWCIMDFCVPGLLGNCKEFAQKYQSPLKSQDTDIIELGNEVREDMGQYFLRRLKVDVAKELPEKNIRRLEYSMPDVQREYYNQAVQQARKEKNSPNPPKGYMLVCIQRLREISDHPYLGTEKMVDCSVEELIASSAKLQAIIPILDEIRKKKEKVIIFAERRDTQSIIKRILCMRYQIKAHVINGDTPTGKSELFKRGKISRQQAIDDFQNVNGFNVIIMSPIAAGMGLNVTGANHVIHYSRHWNPAKENQATDRVYRIGQDKDVFVYYPMAVSDGITTFDQTLDKLLERKSQLAEATLFPSARIEVNSEELFNALVS